MPDRFQTPSLKGKRHEDPPTKGLSGWKFKVGLSVKKYPIQVALLCALIPVFILSILLLGAYHRIGSTQDLLLQQQQEIQVNRKALTFASCVNNNSQTHGLNKLNDTMQALIASSPKQYEAIRPVLERAGIDVDALKAAAKENIAQSNANLEEAKVRGLDCALQVRQVEHLSPPKEPPPRPANIPTNKK